MIHGVICCFKASETLLGIETVIAFALDLFIYCFKASETLLGIETSGTNGCPIGTGRFKASETLLGIETDSGIALFQLIKRLQSL